MKNRIEKYGTVEPVVAEDENIAMKLEGKDKKPKKKIAQTT